MLELIIKGENYIVDYSVIDDSGAPVLFANMVDVEVVIVDSIGTDSLYSKTSGEITEGSTTSSITFEIPVADINKLGSGLVKMLIKTKVADGSYAGGYSYKKYKEELFILR